MHCRGSEKVWDLCSVVFFKQNCLFLQMYLWLPNPNPAARGRDGASREVEISPVLILIKGNFYCSVVHYAVDYECFPPLAIASTYFLHFSLFHP